MIQYDSTSAASGAVTNSYITIPNTGTAIDNTYWPYQPVYPYWGYSYYPAYSCDSQGHDYAQARSPNGGTLFCRKCGDSKVLMARKKAR